MDRCPADSLIHANLPRYGISGTRAGVFETIQRGRGRHEILEFSVGLAKLLGIAPARTTEHIPPAEPIKEVEKRLKTAKPKLVLDGPDAHGLLGAVNPEEPPAESRSSD